ncbi:MAG: lysophospholipid acyltransferase family protein [Ketobacteraceae bacterium]|nr:lysophospholipid acyltransferase family protein [Ketobacteraceae bacterium]
MNAKVDFRYHDPDPQAVNLLYGAYELLCRYHRHRVVGMENIPAQGRCLLAVNHSFATYDNGILVRSILRETGRLVRSLGDRSLFYVPAVGKWLGKTGTAPARPHVAEHLLSNEEALVLVAPGGMREALRPSSEKYKVRWETRKGFVRLAIKTRTPIILSACPDADNLYTVYENTLTKMVYRRARLPLVAFRGLGPTLLPRPVELTHYLSELLWPPEVDLQDEVAFEAAVDEWHGELTELMNTMLQDYRSQD